MAVDLIIILRLTQALLSLIALALNASVIHFFNTHERVSKPPGYLIFLVFTSTWTLLVSIPYTTFAPPYFPAYINRWASLAFELVTTIFWFSGFVAGAVWLASIDICVGLMCSNARAGAAFAALVWLCFCVTSYFPVKYCFFDAGTETVGISGAEKIKKVRMRREKNNLVDVKAERDEEGEEGGFAAKVTRRMRQMVEVVKVRSGNVLAEWRTKAGRNRSTDYGTGMEMRQGYNADVAPSSIRSRSHGHGGRSVSPEGGYMV